MATSLQHKRTTVSGRTPNTTSSGNTSYILPGELAVNLTDQKVYSSNGSTSFEVGANVSSLSVAGDIQVTGNVITSTTNRGLVGGYIPGGTTTYAGYFSTGNYASIPDNAAFAPGASDFTIECWVKLNSVSGECTFAGMYSSGGLYFGQNNGLLKFSSGYVDYNATSGTMVADTWYHVAAVKASGTLSMYVNGVSVRTPTNVSSDTWTTHHTFSIGSIGGGSRQTTGYISNLRVVVGVAVYTGTFTVPTSALTATQASGGVGSNIAAINGSETKILTLQNSTFVENALGATVTVTGTVTLSSQQFFASIASYFIYDGSQWLSTKLAVGANVVFDSVSVAVGNSIGNVTINQSGIIVGNSTVGTVNAFALNIVGTANAVLHTAGANVSMNVTSIAVGNSTGNVLITQGSVVVGNSTVGTANAYIGNFVNYVNAVAFNAGANVVANVTSLAVGNTTGNVLITQSSIVVGNSTVGTVNTYALNVVGTANAVLHTAGANVLMNVTSIAVGNTTGNVLITQTQVSVGNTTQNTQINANNILISGTITANGGNGTSTYVLTSAGASGNVYWAAPTSGGTTVTLVANSTDTQTFYLPMANTTSGAWSNGVVSSTKLSFVPSTGVLTVPLANVSTSINVGANVSMNVTSIVVGNTTGNVLITQGGIVVGNSTIGTVNAFALNIVGTANAVLHTAGANVSMNVTSIAVGNSISNTIVTQTQISVGNTTQNTQINANNILIAGTITANGGNGTSTYVLTSAGASGNVYWAAAGGSGTAVTLIANTTDTQAFYLPMSNTTSGSWTNGVVSSTKLSFVPSTGVLTTNNIAVAGTVSANGSNGTATYVLTSAGASGNVYWAAPGSGSGTTVTLLANTTDTQTFYFPMANTTSGAWSNGIVATTKISFVPSTGFLTAAGIKLSVNDVLTFNDNSTQNTAFRVYDTTGTRLA